MKLLRTENVLVDWSQPLYINFTHCDIVDELVRLYEGTGTVDRVLGDIWACKDPEDTVQIEDEVPEGEMDVRVRPLRPEHAEGIHELYPANDMECHELFLRLIKTLPAAGVFAGDRLAAWMVQSYYGAMFSMQTRPEFRRKGYGTKLARYLTKAVAERGYNPFVVIRPENEASQSLYTKLGFRKLYQTVRATFTPEGWLEPEEKEITDDFDIVRENFDNAVRLQFEQSSVYGIREYQEFEDSRVTIRKPLESFEDLSEPDQQDQTSTSKSDEILKNDVKHIVQEKYASEEDVDPGNGDDEPKFMVNGDRENGEVIQTDEKDSLTEVDEIDEKETICAPLVEDSNEGDGGTESDVNSN